MCQFSQKVIKELDINIELFFQKLDSLSNKNQLTEIDKTIICQSLLGYSRQQIAKNLVKSEQQIRDKLSKYIYPKIAESLQVYQDEIAGNWVIILNFLLNPNNGYKLNPAPQLNSDNFQGSFGRQLFLYPPNPEIVKFQIEGTQFYQQGLYYQASKCFLWAWKKELEIYGIGNPEILIYINNCLIEYKQSLLETRGIEVYTLAVVVPFYHNHGHVAAEILRGIAQIQLQLNLPIFDKINLEKEINFEDIRPHTFFTLNNIVLRTLEKHDKYIQDSQSLLIKMNQYFKEQKKQVRGVTGIIEFNKNGDRINPPAEIVAVKWDTQQQKWKWTV